jgi:5-formyltetrahydrofolate cyclo-ligase
MRVGHASSVTYGAKITRMSEEIAEAKSQLRQSLRKLRTSLGEETRVRASQSICDALEAWQIFQQSETILTYMPIKGEVDLTPLLERHPEKHWVLPRIIPEEDHRMVFHAYDAARLVRHPFGMAEPTADSPEVPPEALQLVLVPGLAFDSHGWRLGYGGGYFDRFLKSYTGISVGIVIRALFLESLPHGGFDVSMRWIATENGILKIR